MAVRGQIGLIWSCSLVLSTATIVLLSSFTLAHSFQYLETMDDFLNELLLNNDKNVIAIGSSQLRYAIPYKNTEDEPESILGDGRTHSRISVSGISEDESLHILEKAINSRVSTILLDASPLFIERKRTSLSVANDLYMPAKYIDMIKTAKSKIDDLQLGIRIILSKQKTATHRLAQRANKIDERRFVSRTVMKRRYPNILRQPHSLTRLKALIHRAQESQIELILIAAPYSTLKRPYVGHHWEDNREKHFKKMAALLDVKLFYQGEWPDSLFIDQSHVNRQGRSKYLSSLSSWYLDNR